MMNEQQFLEPEIRCDFFVSEKRKKVWKVELDILADFISICQRHNLKYFLFAGSMLGAARHQGIIPWDDDIDVAMPRKDYEELLRVAPEELQEQHILVNYDNREGYYLRFSKVCNKNTSAMETYCWQREKNYEQGIFLDIFPFDNIADSKIGRKIHHCQIRFYYALLLMKEGFQINERKYGKFVRSAFNLVGRLFSCVSTQKLSAIHHRVTTKYNKRNTREFSFIGDGYSSRFHCPIEWADDLIDVPFEYLTVKIPKQYDAYLTRQFGDWHKFVKGTSMHNGIFFDPDRPYTEYLGRFEEFKDVSREL